MTTAQLKTIHVARRQVFGADDAPYRLLLKNTAGVESSKHLTNATFEDVMAVLEDMGFTDHHGPHYWRDKVFARRGTANARMVHLIYELAAGSRYKLHALCRKFSHGRTEAPEHLDPKEAWNLIEMLKAANDREKSGTEARSHEGTKGIHSVPSCLRASVPSPNDFTDDIPF